MTLAAFIPSYYECYIFWNDFKTSMFTTLCSSLQLFPHIHLSPNYCEQITLVPDSNLVNFAHEHINEFTYILIVHGNDRCYEEIFRSVTNQYGQNKIRLLEIVEPYNEHIQKILIHFQTGQTTYNFHDQPGKVELNRQQKLVTFFPSVNVIHRYDVTKAYLTECFTIKRLEKFEPKRRSIYRKIYHRRILRFSTKFLITGNDRFFVYLQIQPLKRSLISCKDFQYCSLCQQLFRCVVDLRQHQAHTHGDLKHFITTRKKAIFIQSRKFQRRNLLRKTLCLGESTRKGRQCLLCSRKFLINQTWKKHIEVKHIEYNLDIYFRLFSSLNRVLTARNHEAIMKISMSQYGEKFSCWTCKKKYQYNEDRIRHFITCHFSLCTPTGNMLTTYRNSQSTSLLNPVHSTEVLINTSRKLLKCWKCEKNLKSENGRLDHFLRKHSRAILSIPFNPTRRLLRKIEMVEKQMLITSKQATVSTKSTFLTPTELLASSSPNAETRLNQKKSAELTYNRIGKTIYCSQCNKKFQSTAKFKKHSNAKHSRARISIEQITIDAQNSFDARSVISSAINALPSSVVDTNSTLTNQTKNTEEIPNSVSLQSEYPSSSGTFDSSTAPDADSKTNDIQSNSSLNFKLSSIFVDASVITKDGVKARKHRNESFKMISCWQCSRKFESAHNCFGHFFRKHSMSFQKKVLTLSTDGSNPTRIMQHQTNNKKVPLSFRKQSVQSSYCMKGKFQSHLAFKHTDLAPFTDINGSSFLKKQPILAQQQMKTKQDKTTSRIRSFYDSQYSEKFALSFNFGQQHKSLPEPSIVPRKVKVPPPTHQDLDLTTMHSTSFSTANLNFSNKKYIQTIECMSDSTTMFSCWQCSKKFKAVHSRFSHFINHYTILISDDNSIDFRHNMRDNRALSNTILSKQFSCWSCRKKFELDQDLIIHFVDKHANFILSVTTNPIDILKDAIIKAKQQRNTSSTDDASSKKLREHTIASSDLQQHQSSDSKMLKLSIRSKDQNNAVEDLQQCSKMFFCWKCPKKYKSAYDRLYHFLFNHSESFLPTMTESFNRLNNHTLSSQISTNSLSETHYCWNCTNKFRSPSSRISHFIDKHAKTILTIDIDPSDILKDQIIKAQEIMMIKQDSIIDIKASYICSHCPKKFKTSADRSQHLKNKHARSILTPPSKLFNNVNNEGTILQKTVKIMQNKTSSVEKSLNSAKCLNHFNSEYADVMTSTIAQPTNNSNNRKEVLYEHTKSTEPKLIQIHISYYCQQCQKKFTCTTDHLQHFQTEHPEMKSSDKTLEEFFVNPIIMQCSRAKFTTLVYLSLGSTRKQISIKCNSKLNHCPYQACQSGTVNYDFKDFWVHIIKEHDSAQIMLECCDPKIMYTTDEYKKHILHPD
ncbi:unnamed protein product [Rotaria socialis]|nr:unnamed protein product [Rotaria socialis]